MKRLFSIIGFLFLTFSVSAQINITFPTTRIVFQRNNNNTSDVYVTGTFSTKPIDRVEARLSPFVNGQGTDTGWQVIQTNPQGNSFFGKITGTGGWYRLDVRTISGSTVVETNGVDRIGIGEVFVIAGQSNAQGKYKYKGEKGASDDRVSCVNYFNADSSGTNPTAFNPLPRTSLSFQHVDQSVNIGPNGYGVWCWGELGDMLTARLNVPVIFFNAALQNTSVGNWYDSAKGLSVNDGLEILPKGFPYVNLKNTLNFYVSILGIRAILWHQGESDNQPWQTQSDTYANTLKNLINFSRTDANKNISWVISRASLTFPNQIFTPVIAGQNQVVSTQNYNVFAGPETDGLQVPRPDGVHFMNISPDNAGLTTLAYAWNAYLSSYFFQNSTPYSGTAPIQTQFSCNGNSVTLSLPNSYSSYLWTNGGTANNITVSSSDNTLYSALVKDNQNNYSVATPFVPNSLFPKIPFIIAKSATQFCNGGSVTLTSTTSLQNLVWSSGETSTSILVKTSGNYSLTTTNSLGCSIQSNNIAVTSFSLPATPSITISNSPPVTCQGAVIVLTSSATGNSSLKPFWTLNTTSTDSTSGNILVVNQVGNYNYILKVKDGNGCFSLPSSAANLSIRPTPPKPVVTITGAQSACAGNKLTLSAPSGYRTFWTTGDTTQTISFSNAGNYNVSVLQQDAIGCSSPISDPILFTIHPLPPPPSITVNGSLNICEGSGAVVLTASGNLKTYWTTNDSTRSISFTKSGDYTVSAKVQDAYNCISFYSSPLKVSIRPIPATPTIQEIGPFTLQAVASDILSSDTYEWKKDNLILANKTAQIIKTSQQGYYVVSTLRNYQIDNSTKLTCRSNSSSIFSYVPNPLIGSVGLYPNPNSTGIFNLETKDDLTNANLYLYTQKGQLLKIIGYSVLNERKILDFSEFGGGEYLLKLQSDTFSATKRVVIAK